MRINWFFLIQTIAFFNSQQPAHYLAKYIDCQTTKEVFNWKQHLIYAGYSGIVIIAVIIGWDNAGQAWGIGELTKFTAFLLGYFADSVVKNLTNFNPLLR